MKVEPGVLDQPAAAWPPHRRLRAVCTAGAPPARPGSRCTATGAPAPRRTLPHRRAADRPHGNRLRLPSQYQPDGAIGEELHDLVRGHSIVQTLSCGSTRRPIAALKP